MQKILLQKNLASSFKTFETMDLYPVNFTYVKLQYEDYYVNDGEKKLRSCLLFYNHMT